ncbi:hypothetical protein GXB85_11150 [Cellulomonas sp. APG4]|uniref:hypothetical protein n=1 Tax=Cellulomonas sp. APG4 TaxID=1538656 RepID=UPI00137B5597|nr:hypothetical protein [Cellulomonas sp. APG4]NCT91504.1 hypothetical protein [Cellulomonas sp. APG4]
MTDDALTSWGLDLPGLDADGAHRIAAVIRDTLPDQHVIVSDPSLALTLRMDRATVAALRRTVALALRDISSAAEEPVLRGLAEDFEEWLSGGGEQGDDLLSDRRR